MSGPPGQSGADFEVVVLRGRRRVWSARARAAGAGARGATSGAVRSGRVAGRAAGRGGRALSRAGRAGVERLRAYLHTPEGRAVAAASVKLAGGVAAVAGGLLLARAWLRSARGGIAAAAAGFRAAAGAVAAALHTARVMLSLRWIPALARWLWLAGTFQLYGPCPDCHSRIHSLARVCYRCGYRRPVARSRRGVARLLPRRPRLYALRRTVRRVRWGGRVATFRLYRPCADCRRWIHADARVCRHCGHRPERRRR